MSSGVFVKTGAALSPPGLPAINPATVLKSFNTWAFKREQPTEPDLLLRTIATAAANKAPLKFVLYWGKGPRSSSCEPESACLDFLAQMLKRVDAAYPYGTRMTLIQTDTHAVHNGHCATSINAYFADVTAAASERGFPTCLLSGVVRAANIEPGKVRDQLTPETLAKLKLCAAKWYRGEGSSEVGAKQYFMLNMIEKRAIEALFPDSIFITFNGHEFRELFPQRLPVFYMYSMRKGSSVKPWFEAGKVSKEPRPAIGAHAATQERERAPAL